jgi:hypothetical protein
MAGQLQAELLIMLEVVGVFFLGAIRQMGHLAAVDLEALEVPPVLQLVGMVGQDQFLAGLFGLLGAGLEMLRYRGETTLEVVLFT